MLNDILGKCMSFMESVFTFSIYLVTEPSPLEVKFSRLSIITLRGPFTLRLNEFPKGAVFLMSIKAKGLYTDCSYSTIYKLWVLEFDFISPVRSVTEDDKL